MFELEDWLSEPLQCILHGNEHQSFSNNAISTQSQTNNQDLMLNQELTSDHYQAIAELVKKNKRKRHK